MATLYRLHRIVPAAAAQCPPCHGECAQGRFCNAAAPATGSADPLGDDHAERHSAWGGLKECAPECAKHAEPAPTKKPDRGPLLGVILILTGWPLVAALVAVAVFIAQHLPRIPG